MTVIEIKIKYNKRLRGLEQVFEILNNYRLMIVTIFSIYLNKLLCAEFNITKCVFIQQEEEKHNIST